VSVVAAFPVFEKRKHKAETGTEWLAHPSLHPTESERDAYDG
jgi:hypothetical protein